MFKYIAGIFNAIISGRYADFESMVNLRGLKNLISVAVYCAPLDKFVMREKDKGISLLSIRSGRSH